jgi:hypothetical protein
VPVNTALSPRFRGIAPFLNLVSGNGAATPDAAGPALDPTLFNGGAFDQTWEFISTHRDRTSAATLNDPLSLEHAPEVAAIAALIQNLIPGTGISMYNYVPPPDQETPYPNPWQGVALCQYDPQNNSRGPNWRLWYEAANENGRSLKQNVI